MAGEEFAFQGTIQAFILALGLGMIGTPMTDLDAQADQPGGQDRFRALRIISPRRAIIHQHPFWQPIKAKNKAQFFPYRLCFSFGCVSFQLKQTSRVE